MTAAVLGRQKRKTAGRRMTSLVGKAQEEDDAFWGHETWAEDADSGNESFHDSDEDSALKKDEFDSDFNDSESDNEEEERAAGEEEERELKRQERSKSSRSNAYVDIKRVAKKTGKRIRGDGMNAGIVLNFPPAFAGSASAGIPLAQPQTAIQPPITTSQIPVQGPPKKIARNNFVPTTRETRSRISKGTKRTRSTKASSTPRPVKKETKTSTKKAKRRLYRQEELLIEAVNETEPENQRWLLGRQRIKDLEEKDRDALALRDKARGKIVQKYHSRRACLITLTFPEMDSVPDILTRPKIIPTRPEKVECVITGKPARYRDPKTNLGYYDLAAFKELRRRMEAKEPLDQRKKKIAEAKKKEFTASAPVPVASAPNQKPSQTPSTPTDNNNNNKALLELSKMAPGTPVSPGGRRSSRAWKPSEKMIKNIISNQHVKMAERICSNSSEIPETPGVDKSKGSIATKNQAKPITTRVEPVEEKTVESSAPVESKEVGTKKIAPVTDKPSLLPNNPKLVKEKKPTATVVKKVEVPKPSPPITSVNLPSTSKPTKVPIRGKIEQEIAERLARSGNIPKPVKKIPTVKLPSATDASDSKKENGKPKAPELKPATEQVYVLPKDDRPLEQSEPKFVTQSELIMQVISNYSKAQDEGKK